MYHDNGREDLHPMGWPWLVIGKVMMSQHLIQRSRSQPHIISARTRRGEHCCCQIQAVLSGIILDLTA